MKQNRRYRKLTLALVAALIALLAIGAVAAVIGNNQLKDELSDAGAKDMAERVQDVHLADAGDGFKFTIDEAAWEGDDLYISYTLSVPEDGNTYLVGLLVPRINGRPAEYRVGGYLEDGWTCSAIALGGDFPATDTFVKPIIADSRELDLKDMKLEVGAAFFKANRPLQYLPDFYNEAGDYAHPEMLVPWKSARWSKPSAFPNSDTRCTTGIWTSAARRWWTCRCSPMCWRSWRRRTPRRRGHVDITYDSQASPGRASPRRAWTAPASPAWSPSAACRCR